MKINFNKCPVITYKLKSRVNVNLLVRNKLFTFTRIYHSKGELRTDTIECRAIGIGTIPVIRTWNNQASTRIIDSDESEEETTIKLEGCDSYESACKIKTCLSYYGEVLTDITENTHYDPDPNAQPVRNGTYQVRMKLSRQIPNYIPAADRKIRISKLTTIGLMKH